MRVTYLEQIIKGMRVRTETENAARRVLISRVDKLRWCFWHAKLEKAKTRMQGILILCRVIVPETPGIAESLAQLDYRTRELVEYVESEWRVDDELRRATSLRQTYLNRNGRVRSQSGTQSAHVQTSTNALVTDRSSSACADPMCCDQR